MVADHVVSLGRLLFVFGDSPVPDRGQSGRLDLNQRPFDPQSNALPNCATPRA